MLQNPSVNINRTDFNGVNAYFQAGLSGNVLIMRRLLEKGPEMFQKNSTGSNILHMAVKKG